MECISNSIARCQVAESAAADASSYDVGSSASVKNIPGEYLSGGCNNLSDHLGMTGLVAPSVDDRWSEAEPFGFAELVDSVREMLITRETDLVLWVGPS